MNMKYILFLVFGLFFLTTVFSASITNYQVPSNVPLNQVITITGVYTDANVIDVKCSFYFIDMQGNLVQQATDEYTSGDGTFASTSLILTEPVFQRDSVFTAHTNCGTATADANFVVGQKQDAFSAGGVSIYPQGFIRDAAFWTEGSNPDFFFYFVVIMFVIVVCGFYIFRQAVY